MDVDKYPGFGDFSLYFNDIWVHRHTIQRPLFMHLLRVSIILYMRILYICAPYKI